MTQRSVRQGDVLVTPCDGRPSQTAKKVLDGQRVILAYGEVTGHAHEVIAAEMADIVDGLPPAMLFEEPDGARMLIVDRECILRHEEHGPINLAPGVYKVTRQSEYSPEEIRNVAD